MKSTLSQAPQPTTNHTLNGWSGNKFKAVAHGQGIDSINTLLAIYTNQAADHFSNTYYQYKNIPLL